MVDEWRFKYQVTPEIRIPAFTISIAPDHSCSDKRGMNDKAIKLKLLCFLYMYTYMQLVKRSLSAHVLY